MKGMFGYGLVLIALCLLSIYDLQNSEASENWDRGAYYAKSSLGLSSNNTPKKKTELKVLTSYNKLAVWPERILKVNHRSFLLAQAFAVKSEEFREEFGEIVTTQAGFTIFVPQEESRFDGFIVNDHRLPVVISESSGELGVVTGNVVVKLKSPEVAGLVSSAVKSVIVSVNDNKKTATLKLPFEQDLTEVIHVIRNYTGVESAEFQVLTRR